MWENLNFVLLLTQQVRGWIDKNHRARKCRANTQTHTITASHKRMVEKSKIMRKIFSHRSRHTVVSRLPYQIQTTLCITVCLCLCFSSLNILIEDFEFVRIYWMPSRTNVRSITNYHTRKQHWRSLHSLNSDSVLSHCRRKPSALCVAIFIFLQWQKWSRSLLTSAVFFFCLLLPFSFLLCSPWKPFFGNGISPNK